MIHRACIQGSEEWHRLHFGIPSAGAFSQIITAKKHELAAGRHSYAIAMLTAMILDHPLEGIQTEAMMHGNSWEEKAVLAYEMDHAIDTMICGFCTTDDGLIGASPDRFVGDDGLLEVKSPFKPEIHVAHMLKPAEFAAEHFVQVQGQLYVCNERKWVDLISYFSGLPTVEVRCVRDEVFQAKLGECLRLFLGELHNRIDLARERGWFKRTKAEADHSRDFISDEDVEMILAAQRGI